MRTIVMRLVVILACVLCVTTAHAGETTVFKTASTGKVPTTSGVLPPVGFVRFCYAHAQSDLCQKRSKRTFLNSEQEFAKVHDINLWVNTHMIPTDDIVQYHEVERWALPTMQQLQGDCEDYTLFKKKFLMDAGIPASALRITVALDESHLGHAVLLVRGPEKDFILDNRRNEILEPSETGYQFLTMQGTNPQQWISFESGSLY